jgi:hypothetical protein
LQIGGNVIQNIEGQKREQGKSKKKALFPWDVYVKPKCSFWKLHIMLLRRILLCLRKIYSVLHREYSELKSLVISQAFHFFFLKMLLTPKSTFFNYVYRVNDIRGYN